MPIVMHMPTKHDTMRKPLALLCTITMEMLLVKKVLSSQHPVRRGKCVDASCRCLTAAIGSSMRMRSFAMLMYVATPQLQKKHSQCMWTLHSIVSCTSSCDERVGTSATRSDLRKDGGAAQSIGSAAVARPGRPAESGCEKLLDVARCHLSFL